MRQKETRLMLRWAAFLGLLVVLGAMSWNVISQSEAFFHTTPAFRKMSPAKVTLINDKGRHVALEVRIANEEDEQQAGFEGIGPGVVRRSLILVVYDRDTITRFSMRNVEVPLELAFIRADGTVLDVVQTEPGSTEPYTIGTQFRYVLEAPAGFFAPLEISNNGSLLDVASFDLLPKGN